MYQRSQEQKSKREEYLAKFKDPRWQKMRLEVFERDLFSCQICYSDEDTLHVHHRYYEYGNEPWDYPLEALVTLCEECHKEETQNRPQEEKFLVAGFKKKFFSGEVNELAIAFHQMELQHLPGVVSSTLAWVLTNPGLQRELVDRYFKHLRNKSKNGSNKNSP